MAPLTRSRVLCTLALCAASSIVCAAAVLAPRPSAEAAPPVTATTTARAGDADLGPPPPAPPPQASMPARRSASSAVPGTSPAAPPRLSQTDRPDFSGHWTLVSSTTKASGVRGGTPPGVDPDSEVKTRSIWISGAPVNCGPECTIVQNANTLTILLPENPQDAQTFSPPVVELDLEGKESIIAYPSGGRYMARAAWRGDQLVVTRTSACFNADCTFTQVLYLTDSRLKVVTTFVDGYGASGAPGTLTYVKQ